MEVDGIRKRVERVVEVDVTSFAERYEGYLGVEQVARALFASTDTVMPESCFVWARILTRRTPHGHPLT